MQLYDGLMLLVLVGATLFGAMKGLAWQLASIASMVLSYFAALYFRDMLSPYIDAQPPWNSLISMLVIFLATSAVIWLLFRLVAGMIDNVKLKDFDRQVGALFGAAKGVLLCVVITFFALSLWTDSRQKIIDSKSGYYITVLIDRADAVMPEEIHDVIGPYMHKIEKDLDPISTEGTDVDEYHSQENATPNKPPSVRIEANRPSANDSTQFGTARPLQTVEIDLDALDRAGKFDTTAPSGQDQPADADLDAFYRASRATAETIADALRSIE